MTNLDIETFWAVVQHGTMTAAAEALYITQPTLSMRIRALEERVGTPLFVRSKGQRHITLTAAGQKFLTLAQRWQQLLSETETLAELEQRAYLRIAATYTTNQYILPPVYKRFLALRLPVSLWIHTLRDVDITQALLSHELDFAFIDSNTVFDDRLTVRPAFREPFLLREGDWLMLWQNANSVIVGLNQNAAEEVDPASLDVAEELLVTWDPEFIRWHDRWFGTGARPLLYADTLQAADFLPPTEGRWVAAPAIAAASRIGKSARVCRFTSPPPDRVNYLVTRAGEPLTPPALRFLQELKDHLLAQDNVQVYL